MSQAVTYTIDPAHSTAGFKVRHLMVANVRGEFSGVAGTVVFDASAPENSRVEARIDATTVHTRDEKRDGDLNIHGVTKEVTLNVEGPAPEAKDPWGNVKSGASAATKINRKDFGLVWNVALETGGVLVAEEIAITLELELLRG